LIVTNGHLRVSDFGVIKRKPSVALAELSPFQYESKGFHIPIRQAGQNNMGCQADYARNLVEPSYPLYCFVGLISSICFAGPVELIPSLQNAISSRVSVEIIHWKTFRQRGLFFLNAQLCEKSLNE
jgi:hypothetical protein